MTASGVALVPEEPGGLGPAGFDSAPPTPAQTPDPEEAPDPEETPGTEEIPDPEETLDTEKIPPLEVVRAPEEDRARAEATRTDDHEVELRGSLTVAKRVVEKIAEQAASEVTGNGEHQAAYAVRPGASATARPTVDVQLEGADAWVSIDVGLTYPTPLRAAADELRTHLVERLEQLSGVTVRRLDIRISWLGAAAQQPRRLQ